MKDADFNRASWARCQKLGRVPSPVLYGAYQANVHVAAAVFERHWREELLRAGCRVESGLYGTAIFQPVDSDDMVAERWDTKDPYQIVLLAAVDAVLMKKGKP